MPLAIGTRLGPFEIQAAIGAGGVGEIYRARDTSPNRDVVLKVLPASVADDPPRLARFRAEARALAAIHHPNIAQIYGFEDAGAMHALVMELVPGPTLDEVMAAARHPEAAPAAEPAEPGLPSLLRPSSPGASRGEATVAPGPPRGLDMDRAVSFARQIAGALDAAHAQGVVHGHLTPSNIKVPDGRTLKVLDFGLANAMDSSGASGGDVGSPFYLAPEQLDGRVADNRADVWAFGCVLYEMLTGGRPSAGDQVDWSALPKDISPTVRLLLERSLERDPERRLRNIGAAWTDMEMAVPVAPSSSPPVEIDIKKPSVASRWLPWLAAGLIAAGSVTWALRHNPSPVSGAGGGVIRSAVPQKEQARFVNVSRDGTRLVYALAGGPRDAPLSLRSMDQFESKPIPGTAGGSYPLFSPDGQWIAYTTLETPARIMKIPVAGGAAIPLGEGSSVNGAAWGDDNTVVFSGPNGLMRIPAGGGAPASLTSIDVARGERAHVRPQFLPDGRHLLFTVMSVDAPDDPQFAVLDLGGGGYHTIGRGGSNGRYAVSGHLTYARGTTLFAVPFDLARLAMTGPEVPVVEGISTAGPDNAGDYALAETGLLIYVVKDSAAQGSTLAWADRKGITHALPGPSRQKWGTGRLSVDGLRVANGIHNDKGGTDVWILDVQRGTTMPLTFGGNNDDPIWTADGRRVIYAAAADGRYGLYAVETDGTGMPELVLAADEPAMPASLTPDGRSLLYAQTSTDERRQIFVLPLGPVLGGLRQPHPLHVAAGTEFSAEVSPDGHWVAYDSEEGGHREVYVQPFPGPGPRTQVSTHGGATPRWSRDGRELFFWTDLPTSRLAVADISTSAPPPPAIGELGSGLVEAPPRSFRAGPPRELFVLPSGSTWDVTPDREHFLVELPWSGGSTIATVTNWFDELRRRAPVKK